MATKIRSQRAGRASGQRLEARAFAIGPLVVMLAALFLSGSACTPTVTVAVPREPIEINLNIKIEHEIRVKVDKDLDQLFEDDEDLF